MSSGLVNTLVITIPCTNIDPATFLGVVYISFHSSLLDVLGRTGNICVNLLEGYSLVNVYLWKTHEM